MNIVGLADSISISRRFQNRKSKTPSLNRKWMITKSMDECKNCVKYPSHVSKCVSNTGYCKYFPYEMPDYYGQKENLKEEETNQKNENHIR